MEAEVVIDLVSEWANSEKLVLGRDDTAASTAMVV